MIEIMIWARVLFYGASKKDWRNKFSVCSDSIVLGEIGASLLMRIAWTVNKYAGY